MKNFNLIIMFQRVNKNIAGSDSWDGTVKTIKTHVTNVNRQVQKLISKLSAEVATNNATVNAKIDSVKVETDAIRRDLNELINLLKKS
jgi:archaellum component FlaC